jgi:hypothetical protein
MVIVALALFATSVTPAVGADPTSTRAAKQAMQGPSAPPTMHADQDRDGVFDDLERRLAQPAANDRIDVLVVLDSPATADRIAALQAKVGSFEVGYRYANFPAFSATVHRSQVRALAAEAGVQPVVVDIGVGLANDSALASLGVTAARVDAGVDGVAGVETLRDSSQTCP